MFYFVVADFVLVRVSVYTQFVVTVCGRDTFSEHSFQPATIHLSGDTLTSHWRSRRAAGCWAARAGVAACDFLGLLSFDHESAIQGLPPSDAGALRTLHTTRLH